MARRSSRLSGHSAVINIRSSPPPSLLEATPPNAVIPAGPGSAENAIIISDSSSSATEHTIKRQKLHHTTSHSDCKLHSDYEGRRRVCNGKTIGRDRCKKALKPSKELDATWSAGFLPVCKLHRDQNVRRGQCQATATCGERCTRPCALETGLNMLCGRHEDQILECHLLKLPTEIRLLIFELLIPCGPVPAKQPVAQYTYSQRTLAGVQQSRNYGTAVTLMRVDKQTCADVTVLLYQNPGRPFEVEIKNPCILFGMIEWHMNDSSLLVAPLQSRKHINTLKSCNLERIRHLKIKIYASRASDWDLYCNMNLIRKLREALKVDTSRTTNEMQLCSRSSSLSKLQIQLVYADYDYERRLRSLPRPQTAKFYPSDVFASARLMLQFFRNLAVRFTYRVEWKVSRLTTGNETSMIITAGREWEVENLDVSMEKFKADYEEFTSWARKKQKKFTNTLLVSGWEQFKEVESMVIDLVNFKVLHEDHGHRSFMHNAFIALESRDFETLDAMKAALREVCQKYVANQTKKLQKVREKILLEAPDAASGTQEILVDIDSLVSWPTMGPKTKFPTDEAAMVLAGTLEMAVVEDKVIYQVLTPSLLMQRREKAAEDSRK